MRSDVRLLLILAVASCGSGCADAPDPLAPLFDEAVLRFGHEHSCPADRLQVKHVEVPLPDLVESKPPAEVAADAGRLAVWNETVNKELARYEHLTAIDVAGCGSHVTYFCWYGHRIHRDHECIPVDLDDLDFTMLTLKPSAGQWVRERLGLPSPPPAAETRSNELSAAIAADVRAREMAMRQRLDALAKEASATPPAPEPAPPPKNRR